VRSTTQYNLDTVTKETTTGSSSESVSAQLRDFSAQIPADHPAWQRILTLANRASVIDAVRRRAVHNARNKLHTILMSSRAVVDAPSDEELVEQLMPLVVEAGTGLEDALDQLHDAALSDADEMLAPVSVSHAVTSALESIPPSRQMKAPETILDLPDDLPAAMAVADDLKLVFVSLVLNATASLKSQEAGKIWISAWEQEGIVRVAVADNGPGVPESKAEDVFEPFFTTRSQTGSLGLGLTVARMLVVSWGGTLSLDQTKKDSAGCRLIVSLRAANSGSGRTDGN